MFEVTLTAQTLGGLHTETGTHLFDLGQLLDNMAYWANEPFITEITVKRVTESE